MRTALNIVTEELRRLKAAGVKSVAVSEESLAALRKTLAAAPRGAESAAALSGVTAAGADEPGSRPRRGRLQETSDRPSGSAATPDRSAAAGVADSGPPSTRPATDRNAALAKRPASGPTVVFPPAPVVSLPPGGKPERWQALLEQVRQDATCLARVRPGKKVVLGVGSLDARIMFVGEAPGAEEEVQGEPFVGPAGRLLDKMIAGMGLKRSDVYIGNIMNWRPEMPAGPDGVQYGNRPPTEAEMTYCLPYLRAQIEVVNPEVLVALGATAAQGLLGFGTFRALGEVRGRWKDFAGKPLMVTYHPSYILRNQTNAAKRMIWEDLLKVMERAALPISERQRGYFLEP